MLYRSGLIALGALLLAACSGITVNTDYTLEQDFSRYDSFAWHPEGPPQTHSLDQVGGDIFDNRLRQLVEGNMQSKDKRICCGFIIVRA